MDDTHIVIVGWIIIRLNIVLVWVGGDNRSAGVWISGDFWISENSLEYKTIIVLIHNNMFFGDVILNILLNIIQS